MPVIVLAEFVARQASPDRFSALKRVHPAWAPTGVDVTYGKQGTKAVVQALHAPGHWGEAAAVAAFRALGFTAAGMQPVIRAGDPSACPDCGAEYGWNLDCAACRGREKAKPLEGLSRLPFQMAKADEELQIMFGWFYVIERGDGTKVVDHSLEISTLRSIERCAYAYVLDSRKGGVMHEKDDAGNIIQIGRLAEMVAVTPEKKALWGIKGTDHALHTGLWGGMRIDHAETWAKVKAGEYPQFSIGGWARVSPLKARFAA